MITVLSSPKPGTGVTVTAALLAIANSQHGPTTIVDLAGDQIHALGIAAWNPSGYIQAAPHLDVIDATDASLDEQRRLIVDAERNGTDVIVDAPAPDHPTLSLLPDARQVWVLRCCYIALRRTLAASTRPDEVVVIREPQRSLTARDVEAVTGVAVAATIDIDPAIARAVDAGLLLAHGTRHARPALRALIDTPTTKASTS